MDAGGAAAPDRVASQRDRRLLLDGPAARAHRRRRSLVRPSVGAQESVLEEVRRAPGAQSAVRRLPAREWSNRPIRKVLSARRLRRWASCWRLRLAWLRSAKS